MVGPKLVVVWVGTDNSTVGIWILKVLFYEFWDTETNPTDHTFKTLTHDSSSNRCSSNQIIIVIIIVSCPFLLKAKTTHSPTHTLNNTNIFCPLSSFSDYPNLTFITLTQPSYVPFLLIFHLPSPSRNISTQKEKNSELASLLILLGGCSFLDRIPTSNA